MNYLQSNLTKHDIHNSTLKELFNLKQTLTSPKDIMKVEQSIKDTIRQMERDVFLARFELKDFSDLYQVFTDDELKDMAKNQKYLNVKDYIQPLRQVLERYPFGINPAQAIQEVFELLKYNMKISNFMMTDSKRFRYDSMIRTTAENCKVKIGEKESETKFISTKKEYKNKLWILESYADKNELFYNKYCKDYLFDIEDKLHVNCIYRVILLIESDKTIFQKLKEELSKEKDLYVALFEDINAINFILEWGNSFYNDLKRTFKKSNKSL